MHFWKASRKQEVATEKVGCTNFVAELLGAWAYELFKLFYFHI